MMDIEPDSEESEIVCTGRPSREVTSGGSELVNVPGFGQSARDFQPGTQLVSGGPPDTPASYYEPQSELTGLPTCTSGAQRGARGWNDV